MYWSGSSPEIMTPRFYAKPPRRYNLVCKFCKVIPSYLALCPCKMYYVISKDPEMSRACIHFGSHEHPMTKGNCRAAMDQIWDSVKAQVAKTPTAKASAIGMFVGRELLMKGLINEDGNSKVLSEEELSQIFEKWSSLSSLTLNNLIHDARVTLGGSGYVDSILKLKRGSMYDYIYDNYFPGKGSNPAYVLKMSTIGTDNGVDLMRRMQPRGNLALQFIMFDHVKRVTSWTTLGVHMYDPMHCKVMTICV